VGGATLVRVREAAEVRDHLVPAGEVWQFTIPPGIPHAMQNVGDSPTLILGLNTEYLDREAPDVRQEVLIE
jgi:quercetin dioxygenase-like cupin family protein